jgi:DNA repair protein RadA/Sms
MGQCSKCDEWNSLIEDVVEKVTTAKKRQVIGTSSVRKLSEVDHKSVVRLETGIGEFDRVLGGGVVPGSVTLIGGEPGIGKSTITLQFLDRLNTLDDIYYVAGEESAEQISLRAHRLGVKLENVSFLETCTLEEIIKEVKKTKPDFIVVDSIQVIKSLENEGVPGGISQIRYVADTLVKLAKSQSISVVLIGHVTKDGELAGPKLLEHLVDTVLYIEGDKIKSYRFLKSIKNRFGSTDEVGIFRMDTTGMIEVPDPAAEFIEEREEMVIGSALGCTMEGNRPLVVEVQALTSASAFGYPKRSATGFDQNRLLMIIAVLQKYFGIDLSNQDVFINVSGGFKIRETACDLAVMKAIMSSYSKTPLKHNIIYIGEIGLTGKIRPAAYQVLRENEVKRLGFDIMSKIG